MEAAGATNTPEYQRAINYLADKRKPMRTPRENAGSIKILKRRKIAGQ